MVAQLGCPHFFLTLSSADMSWPELFRRIGQQSGRSMTDDDIAALSYDEKSSMLRNDPVLAARHFNHRLKAFFKDVLVGASALGPVRYHFYRIEFQMRGSPHAHCLHWTADGPDMSKATAEEIEDYFGTKVSGQLPPVEDPLHALVNRVQRHTHSVACRKGKDQHCRFSFSRPPSERTILAKLPDDGVVLELRHLYQETNADILKRVRDVLVNSEDCSLMTLDDVLREANITSENYHNALAMSFSGRHLVLQRRPCDVYINDYNLTCLAAWKANMDVQPVLDAYACIMYIVAYVTKDEREMGEVLRSAKKAFGQRHTDSNEENSVRLSNPPRG